MAVCYRIHGDDFLPLVAELFADSGTATNLLLRVRSHPRRATEPAPQAEPRLRVVEAPKPDEGWLDTPAGRAAREQWDPVPASAGPEPAQVAAIYADLPYGPDESPPFDPTSTARHDVHLRRCLDFLGHQTALLPDGTPAHHRAAGNVWVCEICEVAA